MRDCLQFYQRQPSSLAYPAFCQDPPTETIWEFQTGGHGMHFIEEALLCIVFLVRGLWPRRLSDWEGEKIKIGPGPARRFQRVAKTIQTSPKRYTDQLHPKG